MPVTGNHIKIRINYKSIPNFTSFLKDLGFNHFSIIPSNTGNFLRLVFEHEEDSTLFILKNTEEQFLKLEYLYSFEPDINLSDKLEKKLETYNKFDDFIIRKLLKSQ